MSPTSIDTVRPLLEERHVELAAAVGEWCRKHLRDRPAPDTDDDARRDAVEVMPILGEAGWARPAVPGGGDPDGGEADLRACCLVREALASNSPLADALFALQALCSTPIARHGSPEVRKEWLPKLAAGEVIGGFAMTEPEAGSDVGSIATRAVRDGDGWVLDGRKIFISNAGIAGVYTVFASTDPEAGARGLSAFVVPADAEGVEFVRAQVLSEPHPLGEIAFRSCRVPASALLGEPGQGIKVGLATLDALRATVAAAACGMAGRALEEALAHARERRQFGKTLGEFQLVQGMLATMATELAAARLLTYRAAWEADTGGDAVGLRAAMAKFDATEAAQRIVDRAVQVLGGRGVVDGHPVDRLYRAVRALRIYEGTSEVQQLVIARKLLSA